MPTNKKSKAGEQAGKASGISQKLLGGSSRKRGYGSLSENAEPIDDDIDMQAMISGFGANISKSLDAKRKRLESFAEASIKTNNKKVDEVWTTQRRERNRLGEEYQKQTVAVMEQWKEDLEKTKEEEEKLQTLLKQQQKLFQQQRIAQTQRLKTLKKLHEQYMKGMEELDQCHKEQQTSMTSEIKEELALFQKKILMETQYQDLSNVKSTLQNMLAQV